MTFPSTTFSPEHIRYFAAPGFVFSISLVLKHSKLAIFPRN